jgi:hypothetical protein
MAKKTITFEIDDEIAAHFDALVADWKKDPVWLARALFTEELLGNSMGRPGVGFGRRRYYRDATVYFTPDEREARSAERERMLAEKGLHD